MVTEYHLNLGPRDKLEEAVNYISSVTAMLPNVKQQEIRNWLQSSTDSAVTRYKRTLTLNVPFRLQAPFLDGFRGDTWNCGARELAGRINRQDQLMYYFTEYDGLDTRIRIVPEWMEYLKKNQEILRGWSSWEYEPGEYDPGLRQVSGDLLCPENGCAFPEDGETLFKVAERE